MTRTHRKHVPPTKLKSRKGLRSSIGTAPIKSNKQRRVNERAALRREYK